MKGIVAVLPVLNIVYINRIFYENYQYKLKRIKMFCLLYHFSLYQGSLIRKIQLDNPFCLMCIDFYYDRKLTCMSYIGMGSVYVDG